MHKIKDTALNLVDFWVRIVIQPYHFPGGQAPHDLCVSTIHSDLVLAVRTYQNQVDSRKKEKGMID